MRRRHGCYLEADSARNMIRRNEIGFAGTYGVAMIGTRERYPLYNRVEDNNIHHCGALNKYSSGSSSA